jgi:hypothetical protein
VGYAPYTPKRIDSEDAKQLIIMLEDKTLWIPMDSIQRIEIQPLPKPRPTNSRQKVQLLK